MKEQCNCPFCNTDITDFMHQQVITYNRRKQMLEVQKFITEDRRKEMNLASQKRLKKWREENPDTLKATAIKASHSRTSASFAKQSTTIRNTSRKKAVRFAELLFETKSKGIELTAEIEAELLEQAKKDVKEMNRLEKLSKK